MIYVLGQPTKITTERQCTKSTTDHIILRNEARVDRQEKHFDVDNSWVLCLRCGEAISLKV